MRQEAQAWVLRIASGAATTRDQQVLRQWCALSADHAQAFEEARRAWDELGQVGQAFRQAHPQARRRSVPKMQPGRRLFLRSALTIGAAAAVTAAVYPPLGLWTSVLDLNADYRTATGEQRRITLANNVDVDLNTQSRLNVHTGDGLNLNSIELVAGEAAIVNGGGNKLLEVLAGHGRLLMGAAEIEVRLNDDSDGNACVSCMRGTVEVRHADRAMTLRAGEQVIYDKQAISAVSSIDPTQTAAWREGAVVFRQTTLTDAIAEINRYRPGRVMLLDKQLAQRRVSGKFQIARLDLAIDRIVEAFGANARKLPGGVVLLS